jgi:hypothetical protein
MIDLLTDGSLPDGAFNDDHLGTLDAVQGAVHPISNGHISVSAPGEAASAAVGTGPASAGASAFGSGRVATTAAAMAVQGAAVGVAAAQGANPSATTNAGAPIGK